MENFNFVNSADANSVGKAHGHKLTAYTNEFNKNCKQLHHTPAFAKVIARIRAYYIVKGVKSALREVELFESGKKKPKSLEQLLNEL